MVEKWWAQKNRMVYRVRVPLQKELRDSEAKHKPALS